MHKMMPMNARRWTGVLMLAGGLLLGACASSNPGAENAPAGAGATAPGVADAASPGVAGPGVAGPGVAGPGVAAAAAPVAIANAGAALAGPLDQSCRSDADCTIKDIGSCCGYQPRCLNKASPTYAEQVKAKCAKEGRVSACGMAAITGCECVSGKCANITASENNGLVQ